MEGFFSTEETKSQPMQKMTGCGACGLRRKCRSPKMEASGKGEKGILLIAECPSYEEDRRGEPFAGEAGQMLRKKLGRLGIDMDRDCRKINAISCYPGEEESPTLAQIECCRPRVWQEISEFKPQAIFLLGLPAVQSFLEHRLQRSVGNLTKWRGWSIPDRDTMARTFPMFHPSYVLKLRDKQPIVEKIFDMDLRHAVHMSETPIPRTMREQDMVEIIEDPARLCQVLTNTLEFRITSAFDYETTGLKPHREGHRIVTASLANEAGAYSFDMPKKGTRAYSLWRQFLQDDRIWKIAHNMKFEDNWSNEILKSNVNGWLWDSMLAAHILDNRDGITGLKFQAYINFGVLDYSSHISPYLKGVDEKDANSFNRIDEAPHRDLLLYGGMDSLLEYKLAMKQMEELEYDFLGHTN